MVVWGGGSDVVEKDVGEDLGVSVIIDIEGEEY